MMKYLSLIIFIIGCFLAELQSLPIEDQQQKQQQVAVLLPEYIQADLPASTDKTNETVVAAVPLPFVDVDVSDESSAEHKRTARSFGFGGLGGLGGLGNKFSGLGLGLRGPGGWGFGGLHGLGLGGYKPFLGKIFV